MAKLKVFEIPDPVLHQKALPVNKITSEIRQILDNMLETMYALNGVGLAGNQVGLLKRLIVMDCAGKNEKPNPIKMINPEIIKKSEETIIHNEGCLSVPREYADVSRSAQVTVCYLDENGKKQTLAADGLLSVCIQHEIDHLDGRLFIDYLSSLKRSRLVKHLEKRRRREQEEEKK